MTLDAILSAIDEEISNLQRARAMLTDAEATTIKRSPRLQKKAGGTGAAAGKKRVMSAEARARISVAQKKRWSTARQLK